MAAVLEKQDPAAKNGSQVDEQIAQATSRIRAHDLAFGGLMLLALVLVYTTAMIGLDRALVLPDWVRQLTLVGFLAALAGTAYVTLVSPLRKRINPLYAAKRVESTIDDAKNSVTGYVDAQQKGNLNSTVKAALASRAAKSVAEADVNKAVDHRSLIYLGGVAVVFLLALVVLFFVFRPAQFASLLGRAFVPFSSGVIRGRTQLELVKPDPVEPTITTGQSITVAVHVTGKVPSADGPEKVRLLIRHNLGDPNYDELPMVRGETSRDWELRVPDYLVQNGFWYKVAAGDAVTPEYKVTVRSLPMFTEFLATYEYPKYLRRKTDTANEPSVRTYRGTTVTLVARTNREVRDGLMVIESSNTRVVGTPVAGKPDTLQFVFKVTEPSTYKLTFSAANGERTADPFQSSINIETDSAPQLVITKPEEDKIDLPTNGQLKVDGKVGDDFGIDTVTLKMKIVSPVERPLPDVPYMNGKIASFRRPADNSWPTDLDYKGSVDLARLKKDAAGVPLELTPETVIEFWLEATDNCTEPKANVGRSQPKRVRLTEPVVEETEQKNLDKQKDERKNEEKKHDERQKEKLAKENRDPKAKDGKADKNDGKGAAKQDQNKVETKDENPPKNSGGDTKPNEPAKKDDTGMGGAGDPTPMPQNGMNPDTAPPPSTPEQKKIEQDAQDLKNELDKQNRDGGAVKPNPTPKEDERTDPGSAKPQPMDGMNGTGNPADAKPDPKPADPAKPMGKPDAAPAADKSQGELKKPDDPATPKPDEKKADPMPGQKDAAPSETRDRPLGPPQSGDKDPPKEPPAAPSEPNPKQDPNSGSTAKPATQKKDGEPGGAPSAEDKKDPAADAGSKAKPMPKHTRGDDKPAPQPKDPPADGANPPAEPEAGEGKPAAAPPAGGAKPMPKNDPMPKGADADAKPSEGANDPTKPEGTGAAEAKPDKPNNTPTPMGGGKPAEKGVDKPTPNDPKGNPAGGGDAAPKNKLDEKELKELEQAAQDLNSDDPKKKKEAQEKIQKLTQKLTGAEKRQKEREQLEKDLKSDDKDKREAAQKKLDDIQKEEEAAARQFKDLQDKLNNKNGGEAKKDAPKLDEKQRKELEQAAQDLQSGDPKKKQEAQQKLDKAIGEDTRKELEQLGKDLKSDDKDKRAAAQKKIDDLVKKAEGKDGKEDGGAAKKDAPKLDEKQRKELEQAAQDLQSGDPKKKQEAQQKLDKAIGEDKRKELEQLGKDLKSDDKDKKAAAQKKIDDLKKEMNKNNPEAGKDDPKGKELTPEELADLTKKAQDLQSNDENTRRKAQQELDEKIGKENREKLEEMMKNKKPSDPEQDKKAKEQLEKMAKNPPKKPETDWKPGPPTSSPPANKPMEDDAKKRIENAELLLEQFKKNQKSLQAKKGWTDEEYAKFLKGYEEAVARMRKEAEKAPAVKPPTVPMGDAPAPLTPGSGGKVEVLPGGSSGPAGAGSGPSAAPPGFDNAREKFQKALQKKP